MKKAILLLFVFSCKAGRCSLVNDWNWPEAGCISKFDKTDCAPHYYCLNSIYDCDYSPYETNECTPLMKINHIPNEYYSSYNFKKIFPVFVHAKFTKEDRYNIIFTKSRRRDQLNYKTVSLDLSDNKYSFSPTIPSLPNLVKLNLSRNMILSAKMSNPEDLSELKELDLSHNIINMIEQNSEEKYFNKLEKLNLSHNALAMVPDGAFMRFEKINTLDLSYNEINTLNALTFEGLKNVVYLYLAHNRFKDINSSLIRFSKLVELELNDNEIDNLKISDFEKLTSITKLNLRNNNLKNIDSHIFSNLVSLKYIDLGNNKLSEVDKTAFINIRTLEAIDFSKNELKLLPVDMFAYNNVTEFTVEENKLEGHLLKGTFNGLIGVLNVNLSHQFLTSLEDFAFAGLEKVETLLLNHNKIQNISKNSLKSLHMLTFLDLSNNQISSLDFDKQDLVSLQTLNLQNNNLSQVKSEDFLGINRLVTLDLSENKIYRIDQYSFKSLGDLVDFQFHKNLLSGILREKSFYGLVALPVLDISGGILTKINNRSFEGLKTMRELNISNNELDEIQFHSFSGSDSLEILDVSYNKLSTFYVNSTDISNLQTLIINNNLIKIITSDTFKGLCQLTKLILSHNIIENIHNDSLMDLKELCYLDLSHNPKLHFNIKLLKNMQTLKKLVLSDAKGQFTFADVNISLTDLQMSNFGIADITSLGISNIQQLDYLVLSQNEVVKVEVGAFANLDKLRILDLSCNKITFIQPGVFKDNTFLYSLNISHNAISDIGYGVFAGLNYLHTIDMSYNNINNLDSERFYEMTGLTVLIADYNRIDSFAASEFAKTGLTTLSIGGNPIPCDLLIKLDKSGMVTFSITAITLDESKENFHGVTCNPKNEITYYNSANYSTNEKILYNIRDILLNISLAKVTEKHIMTDNNSQYFDNVINVLEKSNAALDKSNAALDKSNAGLEKSYIGQTQLLNLTSSLVIGNNKTNELLNKLTNSITSINNIRRSEPIPIPKENSTINLIPLINKMKQDLEDTIAIEKQNILNELDKKILSSNVHNDASLAKATDHNHEALSDTGKSDSSFLFLEICVGIMFVTMIAFALYKLYVSGVVVPRRRATSSTRNLQEAMDNSTL